MTPRQNLALTKWTQRLLDDANVINNTNLIYITPSKETIESTNSLEGDKKKKHSNPYSPIFPYASSVVASGPTLTGFFVQPDLIPTSSSYACDAYGGLI